MPNYVTSKCRVIGDPDDVERFKSAMIVPAPADHSDGGGLMFSFDAIIPMPPILQDAEASSAAEEGMAMIMARGDRGAPFAKYGLYDSRIAWIRDESGLGDREHISDVAAAFLAKYPRWEEQGKLRMRALLETGYANWYPWAIAHWGTKWGAFRYAEISAEPFAFRFETAWSFPIPIFNALAARYPRLKFDCITYDEGGCFAGEGWFNPPAGEQEFEIGQANDELYERVYDRKPERDDDEDDDSLTADAV